MKKASLDDLRKMKSAGKLFHDPKAREGEDLGPEFWAGATIEEKRKVKSVHLKLEPEVFDFFYRETKGKGHLSRMQAVLKAYMQAHRKVG
jgi:uncharacterized protein (DUF4415 family)